ncbi:MAG TPA: amino acid permease [Pyrinomonadaceae bacterium]|nr:amino acid permease [Pyrinomonadaceae bacterium]
MSFSTLFRKKSIEQIQRDADLGYGDHGELERDHPHLRKTLGVVDLTAFGIAAIIGAGIFSTIGNAAFSGGPAVAFLFVFTAIACAFSALCYAEFASRIPVAGSAYTYAYASFGELLAWIIGWDLLIEYAIGNIAVAISWSDYFTGLVAGYGLHVPDYLAMDYRSASNGFASFNELTASGRAAEITDSMRTAAAAWTGAPRIGGFPIIADLPALGITFVITLLVYIGIRESKRASNIMVALKVAVVLLVIVVGAFYVNPANWSPFAPNGVGGVLRGVSAVFFAYIGFDAITTTAEECKNPRRDLPLGMIFSLVICTVLYIAIALVLTGITSYKSYEGVGDPLAHAFSVAGIEWMAGIVAVSAVIAIATVLLVFQLGQPRIWMAMSRDGLLPKIFSAIHPRFKTPWFSTIVTGLVVAIPSLFMNLTEVTDLTSIGTLFAFVLVSGGVLLLVGNESGRYVPYINSRYIIPALFVVVWASLILFSRGSLSYLVSVEPTVEGEGALSSLSHKFPYWVFILFSAWLTVMCFVKRLSLIPVMGVLTCGYLMTTMGITNWIRFGLWLAAGLVIYFLYGYRHSRLAKRIDPERAT